MRFKKDKLYKVIEIEDAIIICAADQRVSHKKQVPLIAAHAQGILTYLDRYFFERESGTGFRDAHERALHSAGITLVEAPDPGAIKL